MTSLTSTAHNIRFGLLITAIGGFLFTFDLPLLRLADNDKWTLVFARGIFLFLSITAVWWFMRQKSGSRLPYIAGTAGLAVIATPGPARGAQVLDGGRGERGQRDLAALLARAGLHVEHLDRPPVRPSILHRIGQRLAVL